MNNPSCPAIFPPIHRSTGESRRMINSGAYGLTGAAWIMDLLKPPTDAADLRANYSYDYIGLCLYIVHSIKFHGFLMRP